MFLPTPRACHKKLPNWGYFRSTVGIWYVKSMRGPKLNKTKTKIEQKWLLAELVYKGEENEEKNVQYSQFKFSMLKINLSKFIDLFST